MLKDRRILFLLIILTVIAGALGYLRFFSSAREDSFQQVNFQKASLTYPKNLFPKSAQVSLSLGLDYNHAPAGYEPYKDYLLRISQPELNRGDSRPLGLKLDINYSDVDLTTCEISDREFKIFQYTTDGKSVELPTTINHESRVATATINALPFEEANPNADRFDRSAYFTLANKQNRFITGGCGDTATIYLNNGKIYQANAGFALKYDSKENVYATNMRGFENIGLQYPYTIQGKPYELLADTYSSITPFSQVEDLMYSDGILEVKKVIVKDGEKVTARAGGSLPFTLILELEAPEYKAIRAVRQGQFAESRKETIIYALETRFATDTDSKSYDEIKKYLTDQITTMELLQPKAF